MQIQLLSSHLVCLDTGHSIQVDLTLIPKLYRYQVWLAVINVLDTDISIHKEADSTYILQRKKRYVNQVSLFGQAGRALLVWNPNPLLFHYLTVRAQPRTYWSALSR